MLKLRVKWGKTCVCTYPNGYSEYENVWRVQQKGWFFWKTVSWARDKQEAIAWMEQRLAVLTEREAVYYPAKPAGDSRGGLSLADRPKE